jgi:NAD+ kinase
MEKSLTAMGAEPRVMSAWDREGISAAAESLDWIVSLGGDGSLVAVARHTASQGIPILGVNFGRLGFLSELQPGEALARLPDGLSGEGWLDTRPMLRCTTRFSGRENGPYDAVNDVFVGRGHTARLVRLAVDVDGAEMMNLGADGLLVATPTGSTAYSLSAGGPVVAPDVDVMLLTPVTPHPACVRPVILPRGAVIEVTLSTHDDATFSVDGHLHQRMSDGDSIRVTVGPHRVKLLRFRPPEQFYATLMERLRIS